MQKLISLRLHFENIILIVNQYKKITAGIVILLVFLIIVFNLNTNQSIEHVLIKPEIKSLNTFIDVSGVAIPSEQINIGTQATGTVKHVYVELGDSVKKGQLLAVIDNQIQAGSVFNAKIALQNIQNQILQKNIAISQNKVDLARAEVLLKNDAISPSELEVFKNTKNNQKLELNSLILQLKQAENEVKKAEANLDFYNVYAPANGKIVAILAKEGQTVVSSQSATPIFVLANIGHIQIKIKVPESYINNVFINQAAQYKTISQSKYQDGRISAIEPLPDFVTNSPQPSFNADGSPVFYSAFINTDNPQGTIKIGMHMQARIITAKAYKALTVPVSALGSKVGDNTYEVNLYKDNEIETKTITTGITDGIDVEVKQGLTASDTLVVEPKESGDADQN